jgi:hypothetical protein
MGSILIIGLSGYARSGKDEAAKVLVEEYSFTRVSFADKLRDVLYALNPMVDMNRLYSADEPDGPPIYLQEVIDTYTWDHYKESHFGPEIRRLLQRLGTEAGRQTLWDSIWVDAAFAGTHPDQNIVVTDCRFPNEAQAVKDRGGDVWRIQRYGVAAANSHASETSLDDWDFDARIHNNSTIEDYHQVVRMTMERKLAQ